MNKEEKDAVNEMEQIAELLGPEELANTTGGREIRRSEWDKLFRIKGRLNYTMTYLNNNGRNEEISNLATRYNEAVARWKEDIANSPEGSPISISENTSVFNTNYEAAASSMTGSYGTASFFFIRSDYRQVD